MVCSTSSFSPSYNPDPLETDAEKKPSVARETVRMKKARSEILDLDVAGCCAHVLDRAIQVLLLLGSQF